MRPPDETFRSLGVVSLSFAERQALDVLGSNLRKLYAEPVAAEMPEQLKQLADALAAKLQEAERRRERDPTP